MAGLGRTGTLIALYLMLQRGFTARAAMGWLRITQAGMLPGSVIGEQHLFLCHQDIVIILMVAEAPRSRRTPPSTATRISTPGLSAVSATPRRRMRWCRRRWRGVAGSRLIRILQTVAAAPTGTECRSPPERSVGALRSGVSGPDLRSGVSEPFGAECRSPCSLSPSLNDLDSITSGAWLLRLQRFREGERLGLDRSR
jgi:hypothetical protein